MDIDKKYHLLEKEFCLHAKFSLLCSTIFIAILIYGFYKAFTVAESGLVYFFMAIFFSILLITSLSCLTSNRRFLTMVKMRDIDCKSATTELTHCVKKIEGTVSKATDAVRKLKKTEGE